MLKVRKKPMQLGDWDPKTILKSLGPQAAWPGIPFISSWDPITLPEYLGIPFMPTSFFGIPLQALIDHLGSLFGLVGVLGIPCPADQVHWDPSSRLSGFGIPR